MTKLLQDVLGKNPQTTCVVIEEVPTDNWGLGGETITVRRKREIQPMSAGPQAAKRRSITLSWRWCRRRDNPSSFKG